MKKISVVTLVVMFVLQGVNVWGQQAGLPPLGGFNVTPPRMNDIRSIFSIVNAGTPNPYWMKAQFIVTPVINNVNTPITLTGVYHIPTVVFVLYVQLFDQKQNKFFYYASQVYADQITCSKNAFKQPSYNLYFFLSSDVIAGHDFKQQIVNYNIQQFNYALYIYVNGVQQTTSQYDFYLSSFQSPSLKKQFATTAKANLSGLNLQLFSIPTLQGQFINTAPFAIGNKFNLVEINTPLPAIL